MTKTDEGADGAIRYAVERYLAGHATGDPDEMRKAFHPDARLQFIRGDAYHAWSLEEYLEKLPGRPADDEADRHRTIARVTSAGDAAVAEVELDYPDVRFVDYLSLLRVGGTWTIVHKLFQPFPQVVSGGVGREQNGSPLVVHVRVRAAEGAADALQKRLLTFRRETLAERGCLAYELHRSVERPREFMLYERWRDPEALEAHMAAPHYRKLEEEIGREGWVDEGPEITRWWPLREKAAP